MSVPAARLMVYIDGDPRGALRAMDEADRGLTRSEQRWTDIANGMERTGQRMTRGLTLPIVAAGTAAIKLGMDFETEMSKIVGLVGVSQEQVDEWGRDLLEMAPRLGKAPRELAEGLYFVTSAGFRGAAAMDVLEISAKASAAGLGETATIADAVTSAINAYGAENMEASRATDILTAAVREGKMEADALAPVFGKILPMASAMGVAFEDVAGTLAVMSRTGTDAAEGATALNAVFTTLRKPTKEAREMLDSAGLSMSRLRDTAKQPGGLIEVMRTLENTFGDNDEAMAKVIPNIRAMRGFMNVLAQDAEIVDSVMLGVADSLGMAELALAVAADTARFKFDAALSQVKSSAIMLSGSMMPAVTSSLESVSDALITATGKWNSLDEGTQQAALKLVLFVAAAGPMLTITAHMIRAVMTLKAAYVALAGSAIAAKVALIGVGVGLSAGFIHLVRNTEMWKENESAIRSAARTAVESGEEQIRVWNMLAAPISTVTYEYEKGRLATDDYKNSTFNLLAVFAPWTKTLRDAGFELGKLAGETDEAGEMTRSMTEALADHQAALWESERGLQTLMDATTEYHDAMLAAERAEIAVRRAKERVTQRQKELTEAIKEWGRDSPQAIAATDDLREAEMALEDAVLGSLRAREEASGFSPDHGVELGKLRVMAQHYGELAQKAREAARARDVIVGPSTFKPRHTPPGRARGTITSGAEFALIGEDGPELVLPLSQRYRLDAQSLIAQAANLVGVSAPATTGHPTVYDFGGAVFSVNVPDGKVTTFLGGIQSLVARGTDRGAFALPGG